MHLWGLTGGIACGKTTVARMFAALGAAIVDADATYHRLLAPDADGASPLARAVAARFADLPLLRPDGSLDRAVLGAHVFGDPAARLALEALTHPAVGAASAAEMAAHAEAGVAHVLYDVPLLYEKQMQGRFAGVVLAWVPEVVQRERLMARDHLPAAAAATRLAAQMPLAAKRALADFVVDNSGSLAATHTQVATTYAAMQARAAASLRGQV